MKMRNILMALAILFAWAQAWARDVIINSNVTNSGKSIHGNGSDSAGTPQGTPDTTTQNNSVTIDGVEVNESHLDSTTYHVYGG